MDLFLLDYLFSYPTPPPPPSQHSQTPTITTPPRSHPHWLRIPHPPPPSLKYHLPPPPRDLEPPHLSHLPRPHHQTPTPPTVRPPYRKYLHRDLAERPQQLPLVPRHAVPLAKFEPPSWCRICSRASHGFIWSGILAFVACFRPRLSPSTATKNDNDAIDFPKLHKHLCGINKQHRSSQPDFKSARRNTAQSLNPNRSVQWLQTVVRVFGYLSITCHLIAAN